ncbi:MAG: group III truncated hemoglobin [Bacteroidetes bacterium]|nr:group III truncated hemoglobin [Bacteroidota bacterium]MBS1649549.1 group III truncated hemoglobin [Bacteroidota bacterium]
MKKDITCRADIELLINTFYEKVKKDNLLSQFFEKIKWDRHLNIMYDFWENIIFQTGSYVGNPMNIHEKLAGKMQLNKNDFKRWIKLFLKSIDELFEGTNADLARNRAISIASVMQNKFIAAKKKA